MRYVILGAGRQGLAIAYDLGARGEGRELTLVDSERPVVQRGAARLRKLLPGVKVTPVVRRLKGADAATLLRGHDAAVSAMPYRFNVGLARAAVKARVSFCDLGGNTGLVKEALKLAPEARRAGVTIVPDCGLAPGLDNVLASIGIGEVPHARHVKIRCGGLPVPKPKNLLEYKLLFSIAGLTNEYMGTALVLRRGKLEKVEAFTEHEEFTGPRALGKLEAFVTSGGTSTAPETFRRTLASYEYKTVRYRGHWEKVRAMIDLGLLDLGPVRVGGKEVVPRDLFHACAEPRLFDAKVKDVAFLEVTITNARGKGVRYRMLQPFDKKTGFTAMEQTTGYPTALIAYDLARGALKPGAMTPERCGFGPDHVAALRARGLAIRKTAVK